VIYNSINDIKSIQIEITNNCQAMCPGCQRNINVGWVCDSCRADGITPPTVNPTLVTGAKGNMPFDIIKKALPVELLKTLKRVEFNGNFGDAPFHPQFKKIVQYIMENKNDNLTIDMSTNGGMHSTNWWADLAKLWMFNKENCVWFAIDGTDNETQQMYRRNVNYDKAIANARAFIDAGGKAEWQFIIFDHNKHQIDKLYKLADEYGFSKVRTNITRSNFNIVHAIGTEDENFIHKAEKSKKHKSKTIKQTDGIVWENLKKETKTLIEKYGNADDYLNQTKISCVWGDREQKIMVEHDATVWQCCYFVGTYLYGYDPKSNMWKNYYEKKYSKDFNSLYSHSLEDIIVNSDLWKKDLHESWNNKMNSPINPRLEMCANHCGKHQRNSYSSDTGRPDILSVASLEVDPED
tara:strand:+ start:215 stop:1438 length:1224 start_codon:yes stop_codon:yes gene_type:complete